MPATRTRGLVILAIFLIAAGTAAGCRAGAVDRQPQRPVLPTTTISGGSVSVPDTIPNLAVLDRQPATTGSGAAGRFFAHKGTVWISFNCVGGATATVLFPPVGSMTVPCPASAVNTTKNQIFFPNEHQVSLRVQAPTTVRWALLVQQ